MTAAATTAAAAAAAAAVTPRQLLLLFRIVVIALVSDRVQTDRRRFVEVDIYIDSREIHGRQLRAVRRSRHFDTRVSDVSRHVRVEYELWVRDCRVDDDVSDAIPAERAGAAARHGQLAAKAGTFVEEGERTVIVTVADEVQRGYVLAKTVESAKWLPAITPTGKIGEYVQCSANVVMMLSTMKHQGKRKEYAYICFMHTTSVS